MLDSNTPTSRAYAALQNAVHFNEIGRHDLAERELRTAIALEPQNSMLHAQLGWALSGLKRADEAEQSARTALGLNPQNLNALVLLGKLAAEAGRNQEAEQIWLEALRLNPTNPTCYLNYAILMHRTGHLEKAEALTRRSLSLDPHNERAHSMLTLILSDKDTAQARSVGQRGVALAPGRGDNHYSLGWAYLESGHPFRARAHLREALRLAPNESRLQRAFAYADQATRVVYLPMYFWSLLIRRLPGKQFAVWGAMLVLLQVMRSAQVPTSIIASVSLFYVGFCIYTWVADPIGKTWVRWFPPK